MKKLFLSALAAVAAGLTVICTAARAQRERRCLIYISINQEFAGTMLIAHIIRYLWWIFVFFYAFRSFYIIFV